MYDDEDVTRQAFTEGFETAQAEVLKQQKSSLKSRATYKAITTFHSKYLQKQKANCKQPLSKDMKKDRNKSKKT